MTQEHGGTIHPSRVVKDGAAPFVAPYAATRLLRGGVAELRALEDAARATLEAARRDAEAIVEEAKRRAADLHQAAVVETEKARAEAERVARADVAARGEAVLTSLQRAGESWSAKYPADVVAYAFKLARRVVECEFAAKPERVLEFVKSALEKARFGGAPIVVYLHPDDVPLVQTAASALAEKLRLVDTPRIVEDPQLTRSSVRVEAGVNRSAWHAGVDAEFTDLKKQLERGRA
jgi:flagellar assembly protein FliH